MNATASVDSIYDLRWAQPDKKKKAARGAPIFALVFFIAIEFIILLILPTRGTHV